MKLSLNHYEIKLQKHFYLNRFFIISTNLFFFLLILSVERRVILAYNENALYFFAFPFVLIQQQSVNTNTI
jgi:hypothetical protein